MLHIELDHWIPDELHLLLRVTDILTRNLILAAAKQDRLDGRRSKNISEGTMVKKLIEQIRSCGAPFKLRKADKKVFEFTSLMGVDKLKLLKKLPDKLKDCQPKDMLEIVKKLWKVRKGSKILQQNNMYF